MPSPDPQQTAKILAEAVAGSCTAGDRLLSLVYRELRALAAHHLVREPPGHSLQTSDLAHEAYLRLVRQEHVPWSNQVHFRAIASEAIRRLLVDHFRRRHAAKRGGQWSRIELEDSIAEVAGKSVDLLALDEALEKLSALDERQCKVVELRFFGGMSIEETAHVLEVSSRTIELDWQMARAWLHRELSRGEAE